MKIVFWATLLLNVFGLCTAILWIVSKPDFESVVSAVALAVSTLSLFHTKPYWNRSPPNSVIQTGNVAGRDIAGGNITKRS